MKRILCSRRTFLVGATLILAGGISHASQQVSNFGQTSSGSTSFNNNDWIATSFTTDNQTYTLNSVTLSLNVPIGPETITPMIFADGSGAPTGLSLETFSSTISSGIQTFLSTGLALAPNTTYWVATQATGTGVAGWFSTSSPNQIGNWTIGDGGRRSLDGGSTWGTASPVGFLTIDATPVPEPATAQLALLGLIMAGFVIRRARSAAATR
jgi:hypothetical protein